MTTENKAAQKAFDPSKHVRELAEGRDYLEVKWRLVWLRTEHPDAVIVTERLGFDDQFAFFKATISIPGGGSATAHGTETPADFRDYAEKAETKAVGRALGMLGYGTQFAPELDEGARIVDSPVQRPGTPTAPPKPAPAPEAPHSEASSNIACRQCGYRPMKESQFKKGEYYHYTDEVDAKTGRKLTHSQVDDGLTRARAEMAKVKQEKPAEAAATRPEAPAGSRTLEDAAVAQARMSAPAKVVEGSSRPAPTGGTPDPQNLGEVMVLAKDRKGMGFQDVLNFFAARKVEEIRISPAEAWAKINKEKPDVAGAPLFPPKEEG